MDIMVSNSIKKALKEKGMSENDLAIKLNLERSYVTGMELGLKYPSIPILKRMCKILNKTSDELFTNIDKEPISFDGLTQGQIETVRALYNEFKK